MSLAETRPSTEGPITMPAAISPMTAGMRTRSDASAANFATSKIMVRSSSTRPRLTPSSAAETVANIGFRLRGLCNGTVNNAQR